MQSVKLAAKVLEENIYGGKNWRNRKKSLYSIVENRRSQVVFDLADFSSHFFWLKYHEFKELDVG